MNQFKNKIRATLAVTKLPDNKLSATFSKGFADNLDNINQLSAKNVASNKYKETQNSVTTLSGISKSITPNGVIGGPISSAYLNVPVVYQYYHPWCWAATIASIVNYKKGTSLSASDVVTYYYGYSKDDAPDPSVYVSIYNHYGATGSFLDYWNETWSDAKSYLINGSPIESLWYAPDSAHAMTVRGFEVYDDGYRNYLLIDPNNGYVSVDAQSYSGDCYYILNSKYFW